MFYSEYQKAGKIMVMIAYVPSILGQDCCGRCITTNYYFRFDSNHKIMVLEKD